MIEWKNEPIKVKDKKNNSTYTSQMSIPGKVPYFYPISQVYYPWQSKAFKLKHKGKTFHHDIAS